MTSPRDIVPQDPSCPWGGFAPPDLQHCEANVCGWITTPANTWSNLAFFAAAWHMIRRDGPFDRWFAWAAAGMGLTSFSLHATFTWWGQYLDYLGIYPYTSLMLALNLRRLGLGRWKEAFWAVIGLSVAGTLGLRAAGIGIQWAMVALIGLVLASETAAFFRAPRADYRPWLAGVGLTFAGVALWILDYRRVWCRPEDHVLQLHAVWHLLAAAGVPFISAFYARALAR